MREELGFRISSSIPRYALQGVRRRQGSQSAFGNPSRPRSFGSSISVGLCIDDHGAVQPTFLGALLANVKDIHYVSDLRRQVPVLLVVALERECLRSCGRGNFEQRHPLRGGMAGAAARRPAALGLARQNQIA